MAAAERLRVWLDTKVPVLAAASAKVLLSDLIEFNFVQERYRSLYSVHAINMICTLIVNLLAHLRATRICGVLRAETKLHSA
jgi:hypothetical protein